MALDDLVGKDALTDYMAEFLKGAAKSKLNMLISGERVQVKQRC